MGTLTTFYRMPEATLDALRGDPILLQILLTDTSQTATIELGPLQVPSPPLLRIDKSWDMILDLLPKIGRRDLRDLLAGGHPVDGNRFGYAWTYSPAVVQGGAATVASLELDRLNANTGAVDLDSFLSLEYTSGHLQRLLGFWQRATENEEGILANSS